MSDDYLVINVHFEGEPTFSGIRTGDSPYEWPPSPARLFSALVAGAAASPEHFESCLESLRVLERLPNPIILAGENSTDPSDPLHYAPKVSDYPTASWSVDNKGDLVPPTKSRKSAAYANSLRKGVWPGFRGLSEVASTGKRINGARTLIHPEVTYYVKLRAEVDHSAFISAIDSSAQGLAYFGASRDSATVTAYKGSLEAAEKKNRLLYRPIAVRGKDRGWAPGLVEHLLRRHEYLNTEPSVDLGHPDDVVKMLNYQVVPRLGMIPAVSIAVTPSPHILKTASYLEELNEILTEKNVHARIIPLVDHLHKESDGRLKGILIVPEPIIAEDGFTKVVAVARALVFGDKREWLDSTTVTTERRPSLKSLWPETVLKSSTAWRSVTPVRSFPSMDYTYARLLIDLHKASGVPIEEIQLHIRPATPASKFYGQVHTLGATATGDRAMVPWHITVNFPYRVLGPLQIGSDIRLGYGLLVPHVIQDDQEGLNND